MGNAKTLEDPATLRTLLHEALLLRSICARPPRQPSGSPSEIELWERQVDAADTLDWRWW
ncbi:hypothetical protein FHT77_001779 [Rhizobium sp. BK181]|uniref:hypothetical protein n=1 Tax=Rhizobium sp. BK181 TaxID=2587072 RepID=UPI00160D112E|nr:hypothetical protein [Rhizobium sp. BK181]MBB3315914.1 hypothetical protein [Rhizobium sp. BK181]